MNRYVRNPNVVLRKIHSLYYLIDIKSNYRRDTHALPTLNEVGKVIWEMLDAPTDANAIKQKIKELFDVSSLPDGTVEADVDNYISALKDMGYVKNV